jgi:exodeoxyribonuclease VII small subunit
MSRFADRQDGFPWRTPPTSQSFSFEQAPRRTERIVGRLETGQAPLEESIALYERGALLKAHC